MNYITLTKGTKKYEIKFSLIFCPTYNTIFFLFLINDKHNRDTIKDKTQAQKIQ